MAQRRPRGTPETVFPWGISNIVKDNITRGRNRYICQMVEPWDKSTEWIFERLIPEEVREGCKTGFQYTTDGVRRWNSIHYKVLSGVKIHIGSDLLDRLSMLPPNMDYQLQAEKAVPELVEYCAKICGILYDYAKVSHVFNWLNESNISEAAIVNYCPWVKSLIPTSHKIKGNRYREPQGLAIKLDLIKEVAGIMTKALLVQGETNTPEQGVLLNFAQGSINGIEIPEYKHAC